MLKSKKKLYVELVLDYVILGMAFMALFIAIGLSSITAAKASDIVHESEQVQLTDQQVMVVSKACLNTEGEEVVEYTMTFEDNQGRHFEFEVSKGMYDMYSLYDVVNMSCNASMTVKHRID